MRWEHTVPVPDGVDPEVFAERVRAELSRALDDYFRKDAERAVHEMVHGDTGRGPKQNR